MKNLKLAIFIALFINSVVYATSEKLPVNSEELVCHQVKIQNSDENPFSITKIFYNDYVIASDNKSEYDISYIIKKNNATLKKITLKNVGVFNHTKGSFCEDLNKNQYFVIEDEWEEENGDSGKGVLVIDVSQNNVKKLIKSNFDNDDYTPYKLLLKMKYLPITPTLFEKDGGLYMKVGSTYKSDIITLKKPTSVK